MKSKYLLILFIILATLNACKKDNSTDITADIEENPWKIKKENNQIVNIKWKQFENDSVKLKIPNDWQIEPSKDSWMYFPNDKNNPKLYFSIMKYNVAEVKLDAKKYLTEGFKQISDKINEFHYILKRLSFANGKDCYILTIQTEENDGKYISYSLIYQPENIIYDFAFKTLDDPKSNEINYRKFLLIAQSLEDNNDMIIDGSKFIVKDEKELKFEDLK